MPEAIFNFNGSITIIPCENEELMNNICKKYEEKNKNFFKNIYYLYEGDQINPKLTFNQQARKDDKKRGKINIIVCISDIKSNNTIIKEDIICPKCRDNCLIEIKDYKMAFAQCKNNHKINNIFFKEYNNIMQNENKNNFKCNICKKFINLSYNTIYNCLACQEKLCESCKIIHQKNHKIIEYYQRKFYCYIHNKNYYSFCKRCRKNLCTDCISKHNDKENIIYFHDLIPKKEEIDNDIKEIEEKKKLFTKKIEEIIIDMKKMIENIEQYYLIYFNIAKNIQEEMNNYQKIKNFLEFQAFNKILKNDIDQIFILKIKIIYLYLL